MICVVICDDEQYIIDNLKRKITNFFKKKELEFTILHFLSGEELLRCNKHIDILFLDIQMNAIDGMETARKLRSRNYTGYLIFITVLEEMVFQSFEVQAYDYLVKPIKEVSLAKTMERLVASMDNSNKTNLLIQKGYESRIISFHEIVYCEIIDRKIYLYLQSERVVDYYDRIENLEKKLDGRFFKCHRSYLINLSYLKSYKNEIAYMMTGKEIPVSRLRSKELSNAILQYMKE